MWSRVILHKYSKTWAVIKDCVHLLYTAVKKRGSFHQNTAIPKGPACFITPAFLWNHVTSGFFRELFDEGNDLDSGLWTLTWSTLLEPRLWWIMIFQKSTKSESICVEKNNKSMGVASTKKQQWYVASCCWVSPIFCGHTHVRDAQNECLTRSMIERTGSLDFRLLRGCLENGHKCNFVVVCHHYINLESAIVNSWASVFVDLIEPNDVNPGTYFEGNRVNGRQDMIIQRAIQRCFHNLYTEWKLYAALGTLRETPVFVEMAPPLDFHFQTDSNVIAAHKRGSNGH